MNEIQKQVSRAHRRLVFDQFLHILPWSLFTTLLVAAVALAVPKIWFIPITRSEAGWQLWIQSWIGGSVAVGVLIAAIWTYCVRRGALDAAIEIDRRFGLKERVSSTLSLSRQELETEAGSALVSDATRRVTSIDVTEKFKVSPTWSLVLPLLPSAALVALTLFIANAAPPKAIIAAEEASAQAKKQVKKSAEELQKKLEEQRKKAAEKGLDEANELLNRFQIGLEKLTNKEGADKQQVLVKLNDLSKDAEKRRDELGGVDKLRKQFDQLKNADKGPADKIADALKEGDFKKAIDAAKKLADQLKKGELNDEEKKQLEKQLENLQKKMEEMADKHEQAKKDLEEQIRQREKAGDEQGAAKLQQQLDKLKQQDKQMAKVQQMADKLGKCQQCMKNGDAKDAANQMAQLQNDLSELQKESDELESLEEMMNQIAEAKNSMNCKECNGEGCKACQGGGQNGKGKGNQKGGRGLGEGRGKGDRPEEETNTGFYDTKVGAKPKAGEAFRSGYADGPNVAGKTRQEVQQEVKSALSTDPEPLTNQRLPRAQREQARQYFEQYQPGKNAAKKDE